MAQDTALVVDHVAVAAADSLGLFDNPVEALGAGIRGLLGERDQNGWLAAARKRLAAKRGMRLNTFYAYLLEQAVSEDAEALRMQLEAERADVLRENAALLAVVERVERANEEKAKNAEADAQSDDQSDDRPLAPMNAL